MMKNNLSLNWKTEAINSMVIFVIKKESVKILLHFVLLNKITVTEHRIFDT